MVDMLYYQVDANASIPSAVRDICKVSALGKWVLTMISSQASLGILSRPSPEAAGHDNTTLLFKLSLLFSFSSFLSHCNLPCFGRENPLLCHYTFILKPYLSNKLFISLRS